MKRIIKSRIGIPTKKEIEKRKDQIVDKKVYSFDDLSEPIKIMAVTESFKIFGGAVIKRFFVSGGGTEKEVIKCFDCPLHLVTTDKKDNYCALPVGELSISSDFIKPAGQTFVCTHVCAFRKAQYRKLMDYIEKCGHPIPEEEKRMMMQYLSLPFTRHRDDFVLPEEEDVMI